MSEPAIRISNLSKAYQIDHQRSQRATNLGEAIAQRLRNPFGRCDQETFWALRDIDLEIGEGEVVGVIGRNGAGKSTLLKILSRITEPTSGEIELYGRVGSLLEVGTGFHPELTGRENIFLNGAILGMRRAEIRRQFDAIVDFAGVEKFLDTPVKRYSSGMYVRLAFAVAAHLNPEILIVDEVLAVGDAEFQKRCLGKMHDVAKSGRTVLLVSHNLAVLKQICSSGVLLDRGNFVEKSDIGGAIARYADTLRSESNFHYAALPEETRRNPTIQRVDFTRGKLNNGQLDAQSPIKIGVHCRNADNVPFHVSIKLISGDGLCVLMSTSELVAADEKSNQFLIEIPGGLLLPRPYGIDVATFDRNVGIYDRVERAVTFQIAFEGPQAIYGSSGSWGGLLNPNLARWTREQH